MVTPASFDTISVAGALSLSGSPTLYVSSPEIEGGTYSLITYATHTDGIDFLLGSPNPGGNFSYVLNTDIVIPSGLAVQLVVTPTVPGLLWDVAGGGGGTPDQRRRVRHLEQRQPQLLRYNGSTMR